MTVEEREVCPDCGSDDVSYYEEDDTPHRQPAWYCWGCGIRFDEPNYRDVEIDA